MNRLYRSRDSRMLGGVSGGIAEYFQVDVAVVRLLWIVSVLFAGGGVLAYIIAWIIIPERPAGSWPVNEEPVFSPGEPARKDEQAALRDRRRSAAGLLLVALGIILLAHQLTPFQYSRFIWPALLIGAGIFIFVREWGGDRR